MTATTALDPSFGQRGIALGRNTGGSSVELSRPSAVAVQADGKIVQVGTTQPGGSGAFGPSFVLVSRTNTDGSPDFTFGTYGTLTVPAPNTTSVGLTAPREVRIQADGSILFLAGYFDGSYASPDPYRTAVVKVTPAGTLDTNFGTGGEVLVPESAGEDLGHLVVQTDGRLLVANSRSNIGTDYNRTYSLTLTRMALS